jgi:hypothetical protein
MTFLHKAKEVTKCTSVDDIRAARRSIRSRKHILIEMCYLLQPLAEVNTSAQVLLSCVAIHERLQAGNMRVEQCQILRPLHIAGGHSDQRGQEVSPLTHLD